MMKPGPYFTRTLSDTFYPPRRTRRKSQALRQIFLSPQMQPDLHPQFSTLYIPSEKIYLLNLCAHARAYLATHTDDTPEKRSIQKLHQECTRILPSQQANRHQQTYSNALFKPVKSAEANSDNKQHAQNGMAFNWAIPFVP